MPLSRRGRFVTICGEGPGPRAVPRGRRLAPGPRARRASAVRVPRRTTWAWPARVTWPRTSRKRTRRRPPSRREIGGWSSAAGRYRSEPIVLIRPWARRIRPAAQVVGEYAALWVIDDFRHTHSPRFAQLARF